MLLFIFHRGYKDPSQNGLKNIRPRLSCCKSFEVFFYRCQSCASIHKHTCNIQIKCWILTFRKISLRFVSGRARFNKTHLQCSLIQCPWKKTQGKKSWACPFCMKLLLFFPVALFVSIHCLAFVTAYHLILSLWVCILYFGYGFGFGSFNNFAFNAVQLRHFTTDTKK